jgi:OOP family OmpA-OmpF porin
MKNNLKSWLSKMSLFVAVLAVAGCAEYRIEQLEHAPKDGYPFAQALKTEYEAYAKHESRVNYDQIDASTFAIKGLQASRGLEVLPEDPRMWDIPSSELPKMLEARERLLFAIHKSGRVIAPELAAKTQVAYDCWVNQKEENFQSNEIVRCESGFMQNLIALEKEVDKYAPAFQVFFDFNSPALRKDAHPTLDRVAKVAKNMSDFTIKITGRTDAAGGRKFNLKLSQERAINVRNALVKMGVPENRIAAVGGGEHGTKEIEPKNRRVDIEIS